MVTCSARLGPLSDCIANSSSGPDTKTNWPTDRRSQNNLNLKRYFGALISSCTLQSPTADSEAALVLVRKDAGLRKRVELSAQTSDSSAYLNAAMCLLKCVLNCQQRFSYFEPDYPGFTVLFQNEACFEVEDCPQKCPAK
jgi:hypothetical protein